MGVAEVEAFLTPSRWRSGYRLRACCSSRSRACAHHWRILRRKRRSHPRRRRCRPGRRRSPASILCSPAGSFVPSRRYFVSERAGNVSVRADDDSVRTDVVGGVGRYGDGGRSKSAPVPTVLQGVSDKRVRAGELAVSMSVTPAAHGPDEAEAFGTVFSRYTTHGHTSPFATPAASRPPRVLLPTPGGSSPSALG